MEDHVDAMARAIANEIDEEALEDKKSREMTEEEVLLDKVLTFPGLDEEPEEEIPYKVTHKFFIAGVQHHNMHKVIDKIENGFYLQLTPEPTNKYDPNAIKIVFPRAQEDIMLGYVPKRFSSEVSAAIELDKVLECVIVTFNKEAKPWEQCEVEIREIEEVEKSV